jgi:Collagen triple helix repeat (20 copies)
MQRARRRGRRLPLLAVCVVAAFAATAMVLSVSVAATGVGAGESAKQKGKPKGQTLTKAEVIGLIKRYSSSGATGPIGATGPAGAAGATGGKGENGLKGETGLKGENGENGGKGEKGADGAVAGYSASQPPTGPTEGVPFTTGTAAAPTTILSKSLPAGSYLASAKVETTIAATVSGGEGAVECALSDVPASGSPVSDLAGFFSSITAAVPVVNVFAASNTLPLQVAVDSAGPSTLVVSCWVNLGVDEHGMFFAEAANAHIQAVQTAGNS